MIEVTIERVNRADGSLLYFEWVGTPDGDVLRGYKGQPNFISGLAGDDLIMAGRNTFGELLAGNEGDDTIKGGLGNDVISGGSGVDLMMGGQGDDGYLVDDVNDVVVERAKWAPVSLGDVVRSFLDYVLPGGVERLQLLDGALIGTGNSLNNSIEGNNGNNALDGGRGIDTLIGGLGDDTYILRHKDDVADEPGLTARQKTLNAAQNGHDTVLAHNSFKLMLGIEDICLQDVLGKTGEAVTGLTAIGNNLDNLVQGNATDNSLNGRTGNDTLTGGAGADDFIFSDALGARHADTITDFASGEDRIVIKGGLVNLGPGPLDADAFHLGAEAATAGHRFLFDGATLRYDADGSGAGAALDVAYFDGTPTLVADDIFIA